MNALRFGSVFTGVGGLDLGLERAGIELAFQTELVEFRRAVLARHWPGVPRYADVRHVAVREQPTTGDTGDGRGARFVSDPWWLHAGAVSLDGLSGGSPCQDVSIAGRRRGLAGRRSGLFFEFARIADELVRPGGWIVFENVPGLLSSHGGRDFGVVLRTLGDVGFHDLAWRVLDSRYFGVPQRRRRVFIVARRAVGQGAREVLLEPESGGGDLEAGSTAGPRVAASLTRGSAAAGVNVPGRRQEDDSNIVAALDRRRGGVDDNEAQAGHLVGTVRSHARPGSNSSDIVGPVLEGESGRGHRIGADEAAGGHLVAARTLSVKWRSDGDTDNIVSERGAWTGATQFDEYFDESGPVSGGAYGSGRRSEDDPNLVPSPVDSDGEGAVAGLPGRMDPDLVDPVPDGPRDAAIGDAVTVPVAQWVGSRIVSWERSRA